VLKKSVSLDTKDTGDLSLAIRKERRICGIALAKKDFLLVVNPT